MKELPSKYYLTHFTEFLDFIRGPCKHLLDKEDQAFLHRFENLPEDAQCLFVRGLNRKTPLIKRASLYYDEIEHHEQNLSLLLAKGFYSKIAEPDYDMMIAALTKPQLIELLGNTQVTFKASDKKQSLFELARCYCSYSHLSQTGLTQEFVVRGYEQHIRYFLFLFFGDLYSSLNKFSMRDMGIMRTKSGVSSDAARFEFFDEGKSAFFYAQQRKYVFDCDSEELITLAENIDSNPVPVGNVAITHYDKFVYKLGKRLLPSHQDLALKTLNKSAYPEAQERVIRERFKLGDKEWVLGALETIIEYPESEGLLTFAEDFLARKFQKKRTSIFTDMLREASTIVKIDEVYRDQVERGVQKYYQKKGCQAFRTENRLWRALFGIVFWQELFEADDKSLITEFDFRPQSIVQNNFYENYSSQIETKLSRMTSAKLGFKLISKTMLEKYGIPNGIFRWHKSLLEVFAILFDHLSINELVDHLRAMAKDFKALGDGYPDLMVVEDQKLRFEEVKAPGDQLRKNQLLTIRQLRKHGFNVAITQVEWFLDPEQTYCVVDIETTGGRANNHRITEIGIVKVVGDQVVDRWETLLNPQRHIPRNITQLTGIDNDMVVNAPLFSEIADSLRKFLSDSIFVAHNVNFDYGFIRNEFERIEQPFRMPKLCTVREMRKAKPGLKSYSLANLTEHFGIDMTRHHRAMSDAVAAAELLFMVNEHRRQLA